MKRYEPFGQLRSIMPVTEVHQIDTISAPGRNEQREVTVLILDIADFTAASHRLDSEDVYLIVNELMSLLVGIVDKYEGAVDKFTGDGLIALFGAPTSHENDPERALRASLEMVHMWQPLRQRMLAQHNFDFQVRIGVNTGTVVAGHLGNSVHGEYTVIGDTVNMASRLESAAEPGSVLIGHSTYQRTKSLFHFVSLPPLAIQGFPEPVDTYRPLQLRKRPDSVRGLPGLAIPMVGRGHELARLRNALEMVQAQRSRRISLILGDAGLGKSRLVAELCRGLATENIRYFQGHCLAYARSRPLWVIAEVVRSMAHITVCDPVSFQVEQLRSFLVEQSLDEEEVLPVLLQVLGVGMDEPTNVNFDLGSQNSAFGVQTYEVLQRVLLSFRRMPYVIVLDDLNWVDSASRDVLIGLIRSSDKVPLHLILISREIERPIAIHPIIDACVATGERFEVILLQPLPAYESGQLVSQLIPQTSTEIQELQSIIVDRAEGNPFYAEEIVRVLMDQGGIQKQDDGWVTTSKAHELLYTVPSTLRSLVLTRFDQLPLELRNTLRRSAVLGRSFPADLLALLNEVDMDSLLEQLHVLSTLHFLNIDANYRERIVSFRNRLTQDAIYSTLLRRERGHLHALAADVIKRTSVLPADKQSEALAYHHAKSHAAD